jgi:hypothetical protein
VNCVVAEAVASDLHELTTTRDGTEMSNIGEWVFLEWNRRIRIGDVERLLEVCTDDATIEGTLPVIYQPSAKQTAFPSDASSSKSSLSRHTCKVLASRRTPQRTNATTFRSRH